MAAILEKTKEDGIMCEFIINIISHQNENAHYSKQYKKLIEEAVAKKEKLDET